MSITTKKGDNGSTSLYSGQIVKKHNPRVDCYGTIDELNAFLNETTHHLKIEINKEIISGIQENLYKIMAELATIEKPFKNKIKQTDIDHIESLIQNLEKTNNIKGFINLGKTLPAAKLDICRTITRRAERKISALAEQGDISENIPKYINRLSDLLFLMAISETQ